MAQKLELATLGGGCFWCLEAVYEQLKGVEKSVSGYCGGSLARPTYEQVCSGRTGHSEVVQLSFDPSVVAYRGLLDVFFTIHDPTTPDRQGADRGTQYRSAIFFHDAGQEREARQAVQDFNQRLYRGAIVTEISPLKEFFPAEDYHQGYFRANPGAGYCQFVVAPKVAKFRKEFFDRLKK